MANQRVVRKSKAGVQDLILGKGQVTQQRGENEYQIDRLDVPVAVDSIAEMTALDPDDFTRARVYSGATTYVDYVYDVASTEGEASDSGVGSWINKSKKVEYVNSIKELISVKPQLERELISVLGYHPNSDVGGGKFYWDSTKVKSDHNGGTVIDPDKTFPSDWNDSGQVETWFTADGVGNGVWCKNSSNITSHSFGILETPIVSSIAADNFLNYCSENDVECVFEGMNFKFTVNMTSSLKLKCKDGFSVEPEDIADASCLSFSGVASVVKYQLASPVSRYDNELTVTSLASDISSGDFIVLQDGSARATDGSTQINIEVHKVKSVSGSTIVLSDFVRADKAVYSENIYRISMVNDISIKGWNFNAVSGSVANSGLLFDGCDGVLVNGFKGTDIAGAALSARRCHNVIVNNWDISNPQQVTSGQGYGLAFLRGTTNIHIGKGTGDGLRHSVDFDSCWDITSDWFDCLNNPAQNDVMLAHNGWGGDFQDLKFRVRNGSAQCAYVSLPAISGATNYTKSAHNLNIKIDANLNLLAGVAGFQSEQPIIDSNIYVTSVHGDGSKPTTYINSACGVRMVADRNNGTKVYANSTGATKAVFRKTGNAGFGDAVFDIVAKNCYHALLFQDSTEVNISRLAVDNIHSNVFVYDGVGTLRVLNVGSTSLKNLGGVILNLPPSRISTSGCVGSFYPCVSDLAGTPKTLGAGFSITMDDLMTSVDGVTLLATALSSVTSAATAFENGFYSGQKLTIVNDQNSSTISIQHSTMVQNNGAVSVVLGSSRRSATWVYNSVAERWYEIA